MGARQFQAYTVVYSMQALDAERRLAPQVRERVRRRCENLAALAEADSVPAAPAGSGGLQAVIDGVRVTYESRPDARALHVLKLEVL